MRNSDPALSYQQASAHGASPMGQIVSLYDTILRDFRRAQAALKARDVAARVFELNHAVLVVGHLQSVLNFERGGEVAKLFARFYDLTRGMILQANIRATPEALEDLIELYTGMRQAWHQADQQEATQQQADQQHANQQQASRQRASVQTADRQPAQAAAALGGAAGTNAAKPANDDVETHQLQWSA